MNKRKRTAHRRAALWPRRTAREVADAINAAVPSPGVVVPDDGLNFKRLFPDQWEELLNRHLDARLAGEIPGAEIFTVAPDDGGASYARFRADMERAKALGLVPTDLDGATVTRIEPITRAEG